MAVTDAMDGTPPAPPVDNRTVVKLTRRDVEEAKRLLSLLSNGATGADDGTSASTGPTATPDVLTKRARDILANRRRRHDLFGKAMFGEPAWEILLLLYIVESGPRQTIGRLADLADASKSTALRWVDYLEAQGLVRREAHPTDKRAAFVELTDKGHAALELYLSDTLPPNY